MPARTPVIPLTVFSKRLNQKVTAVVRDADGETQRVKGVLTAVASNQVEIDGQSYEQASITRLECGDRAFLPV